MSGHGTYGLGGVVINPSKVFHIREELMIDLREIAALAKMPGEVNQVGDVTKWSYNVILKGGGMIALAPNDWQMLKDVWFQVTNEWAEDKKDELLREQGMSAVMRDYYLGRIKRADQMDAQTFVEAVANSPYLRGRLREFLSQEETLHQVIEEQKHVFQGRLDRECEVCGMPDRSSIHCGTEEAIRLGLEKTVNETYTVIQLPENPER